MFTCLIGIRLIEGVIVLSYICRAAAAAAATTLDKFLATPEELAPPTLVSLALDVGLLFGRTIACISSPDASEVPVPPPPLLQCDGDPICTGSLLSAIDISTCGVK